MKKKSVFLSISILSFFLFYSSCTKKEEPLPNNGIYEVKPEILTPEEHTLLEIGKAFEVNANFTPYGDNKVVEIIQTKFVNPENGNEIGLIHSELVMQECVYSYSGTAEPFRTGPLLFAVCSYKDEIVTLGSYSFFSFNGECVYYDLFAQDKVGTDFQVKTYISNPYPDASVSQNELFTIKYEFEVYKGDSGVLLIEILDQDNFVIATLYETEISGGGSGELNYQFEEKGFYTIRIKAQQEDGTELNYYTTSIRVN